ncbi:MAG: glycerol-3-phosphate 1-O-acyltransferase PlsY [Pseudomonadota bacterium]
MPDPISWSFAWPFYLAALAFGYALGSIPFGLILTRIAGLGDIRSIGSGNIGATNVLRTGKKGLAALTLLGDALKGTAAVLIAAQWGPETAVIAGWGAFLGHLFPVWLKFKGGKGVATFLGILLGWSWLALVVFAVIWLSTAFLTRFSSLSALLASLAIPPAFIFFDEWKLMEAAIPLVLLLWIKHAPNIKRLIAGTESRIGGKS